MRAYVRVSSRQRRQKVKVGQIRELSGLQVSEKEAAAALGVDVKTFREMIRTDARAREAWEAGREAGKTSIRRNQFALAGRYPQMAIWLGKQYLGQNDVQRVEMTGKDGGPVQTMDLGKLSKEQRQSLREIILLARKRDAG